MKKTIILLIFLASVVRGQIMFQLHGTPGELSGTVVTPAVGPQGVAVIKGTGAINFVAVPATPPGTAGGSGVSFNSCCTNVNASYYKFSGPSLGTMFPNDFGQIELSLTSKYTFAQRLALGNYRYGFDMRDTATTRQLGFLVQTTPATATAPGRLYFSWWKGANTSAYYYIPVGQEDAIFGSGVKMKVTMKYVGTAFTVALNGVVVGGTFPYSGPLQFRWGADSSLFLGAQSSSGIGFNSLEDALSDFTVTALSPPPASDILCSGPFNPTAGLINLTCPVTPAFPHTMSIQVSTPLGGASLIRWQIDAAAYSAAVGPTN